MRPKVLHHLLLSLLFTFALHGISVAQMNIDDVQHAAESVVNTPVEFEIPTEREVNLDFFSMARERYDRILLRQKRNSLTLSASLTGSMTSLSETWQESSGGNNTFTGLLTTSLNHTYSKNLFSVKTSASARLGYTNIIFEDEKKDGTVERDPVWYKNSDAFSISINPYYKFATNWSYGITVKLQSQFTNGYVSSTSQESYHLKSDFMSPGYLDISGDLIYRCPSRSWPVSVKISPVALDATYVLNDSVMLNTQYKYREHLKKNKLSYAEAYGVGPATKSKYTGGSSVNISLTKTFGKSRNFSFTTSVSSYYALISLWAYSNSYTNSDEYSEAMKEWNKLKVKDVSKPLFINDPTVTWNNKLFIRASKIFTTTVNYNIKYNKQQNESIQTQFLLSVGFNLSYSNK